MPYKYFAILSAILFSAFHLYCQSGFGPIQVIHEDWSREFWARAVFAADLDNDGYIDVISASSSDTSIMIYNISWYKNEGNGNFGLQQIISTLIINPYSIYAADLDGDGDIDVLSASSDDNKIAWYENDGNGNFGAQQIITTNAGGARFVYAGDIDQDGDLDVVSASQHDNKIAWYANDGLGNFGDQQLIANIESPTEAYLFDMDGDQDLDVLAKTGATDKIIWYENDGSGNFIDQTVIYSYYCNIDPFFLDCPSVSSIYAADLDSDGDLDVLAGFFTFFTDHEGLVWYENDGIGNFSDQQVIILDPEWTTSVYASDLDGDGDSDLVSAVLHGDSRIDWYENMGDGNFVQNNIIAVPPGGAISVFVSDLDGDGDNDVISHGFQNELVAWYENFLDDTIPPIADCVNTITIYLDESGREQIISEDIDNGSTDNGGIFGFSLSPFNFNCANLGISLATLTVTDFNGNTGTCIAEVMIVDSLPPAILCEDLTISLVEFNSYDIEFDVNEFDKYDNCYLTSIAISESIFTSLEAGDNIVTVVIEDQSGNGSSCSFNVHVDVITGSFEKVNDIDISLSPNPMNSYSLFSLNTPLNLNYDLRLVNVLGQELRSYLNLSGNQLLIERHNLPSGIYLLNLYESGATIILASYRFQIE